MKNFLAGFALCLVAMSVGVVMAQPMTQTRLLTLTPNMTGALGRDGVYVAGSWTVIDASSASAAYSAQLNAWSRYALQCKADAYFHMYTAASGSDATSSDAYIAAGAILPISTTDTLRYVTVKNVSDATADCSIIEYL